MIPADHSLVKPSVYTRLARLIAAHNRLFLRVLPGPKNGERQGDRSLPLAHTARLAPEGAGLHPALDRCRLGGDVERHHEPVGPLELELLVAHPPGFNGVGHQHEAVVVVGSPVLEALDHGNLAGLTEAAFLELHLGALATV